MLYQSSLWLSDLDETIAAHRDTLEAFRGSRVLITGAAGLVCSAAADLLLRFNDTCGGGVTLLAAGRWPEEMEARFGEWTKRPDFVFVRYDAAKTDNALPPEGCDYLIHGASNAFPGMIVKEPVETMLSNFLGMKYLLDYARETGVKRILYISSSEIYGRKENDAPYREGEYGYIDLLNPRNSYSVGKRAAETLCASYADEYGVGAVIVRPGHIYGPTASPQDNRVASAWSYAAAKGEPIVMKSDGAQLRSYCHCLDCASAMLTVLSRGEPSTAYNISNPESIVTIREMAALLAEAGGVPFEYAEATEAEKKGFNPMSNSSLDSAGLQRIGWRGLFGAARGFRHTVKVLREAYPEICG